MSGSERRTGDLLSSYAIFLALIVMVIIFGLLTPDTFLTMSNLGLILGSQSVLLVVALGLLVPLTAGDFDLSIASVAGLSAMIVAILNVNKGWPIWAAVLAAVVAGLVVGVINGALVVPIGIDPFIATLGTQTVLVGVTFWISGSNTISGISQAFTDLGNGTMLQIPNQFYFALLVVIVVWYVYRYTPLGRRLLFVGRGRDVARLSGLAVGRLRWGAMVASGGLSAIGGVLYAATLGGADPTSSSSFMLPAFAACFLGSTTIVVGRFNPWGTFVAVYFLITGITGLQLLGVPNFVQQLFYGSALIIAVGLARLAERRRAATGS